jgi:FSR family fosmidomycin resistance protein-like MFS transporter
MPWLLPLSTLTAGAGVAASGIGGSYALTLTAIAVSGLGGAAYHPEAARAARAAAGGGNAAMGRFRPRRERRLRPGPAAGSPPSSPPADCAPLSCWWFPPWWARSCALPRCARPGAASRPAARPRAPADDWPSFLRLSGAVVCRSVVFVGLSAFVSLYVRERAGGGAVAGTAALCVLYAGGAVGTPAGGRLADRYGRLAVVRWSYALTVPAVAGVVLAPGPAVYLFAALTSAGLYVPFSLHVTLGQDCLPRRPGTASRVTLGLTVSVGGLVANASVTRSSG